MAPYLCIVGRESFGDGYVTYLTLPSDLIKKLRAPAAAEAMHCHRPFGERIMSTLFRDSL
jgi:hypothetical protein